MAGVPPCANARDEAPASTQTTVKAINGRGAIMTNVLRKQAGSWSKPGESGGRQGAHDHDRNTWWPSESLTFLCTGLCQHGIVTPPVARLSLSRHLGDSIL